MEPGYTFSWLDFLSKSAGPVIAAIFAAILATFFSMNRFYKEKWWEKRLVSFTEVIEIAYKIKMVEDYTLELQYYNRGEASFGFNPHSEEVEKQLFEKYWIDLQEIERISQLAEFTLTPVTSQILNEYLSKRKQIRVDYREDAMSGEECEKADFQASVDLLDKLVNEAKRSLKIKH